MPPSLRSVAGGVEAERVVHLHAATVAGLRELDRLDHAGEAARDLAIEAGPRGALHGARRADEERHQDLAAQVGVREQLLLVAVPDLVEVAADVAPDDRLAVVAAVADRRLAD